MSSGSSEHFCPVCGSKLVVVGYLGSQPDILNIVKSDGFRYLLCCKRVDLHDKVVDGVNYRGKVFVKPIFHECGVSGCKRVS